VFAKQTDPLDALHGRKVTVMGLGLFGGGRGVTEFLCRHGAEVTVTDLRSRESLAESIAELEHLPIRWVLGEHKERDFLAADLVVASPAVPRTAKLLELCGKRGVPLETEMNLFVKHCRGKVCAVTGSNGKTTTTALIGAMATKHWPSTRVGGNLGRSLLGEVDQIGADEWVVLELSSFQLEDLAGLPWRPQVAVLTNLSPNHLDRHGTYANYLNAKRHILTPGPPPNIGVLNGDDTRTRSWATPARTNLFFGHTATVTPSAPGVWVDATRREVVSHIEAEREVLFSWDDIPLPGTFNRLNAAAAATAALSLGIAPDTIRAALTEFQPVEHRLEPVVERASVRFVNDSVATTPESTEGALEALGPNVVLICGGAHKGCSFRRLGKAIARRARGAVLLGETAGAIDAEIPRWPGSAEIRHAKTLEDAVLEAKKLARPGDTIVLSPACPSYDQFRNFVERGRRFKQLARDTSQLPAGPNLS